MSDFINNNGIMIILSTSIMFVCYKSLDYCLNYINKQKKEESIRQLGYKKRQNRDNKREEFKNWASENLTDISYQKRIGKSALFNIFLKKYFNYVFYK